MIEPFNTIHLFEGGYCQVIGNDYNCAAYSSQLTTFDALVANIITLAPPSIIVLPYTQINIFRQARSFYLTLDVMSDYDFEVENMDETTLNNFITELKSIA
jgi:hypothetical protein